MASITALTPPQVDARECYLFRPFPPDVYVCARSLGSKVTADSIFTQAVSFCFPNNRVSAVET